MKAQTGIIIIILLNPDEALENYFDKILLHLYFEYHFSLVNVPLQHLGNKYLGSHSNIL